MSLRPLRTGSDPYDGSHELLCYAIPDYLFQQEDLAKLERLTVLLEWRPRNWAARDTTSSKT